MTIHVSDAGDADLEQWDRYVSSSPRATVYHLSPWRRIFGEALGYRHWLLMARDASGAPCGVLPLYLVPGLLARRLVAVPFRDRGGPVFDTPEALVALLQRAGELARQQRAGLLLKSLVALPETAATAGLTRYDHWVRSSMQLDGATRDSLWERIGGKNRNMVRQARQRGLTVECTTRHPGAARRWYSLHVQTQHRLGVPPFPARFFTLMLDTLAPSASIELVEARSDAGPCAATLLLLHNDTCIYGYSASSTEGQRLRANDLMLFEALALAAERKLAWFDFGSDSVSQESLLFFKRKWGAEQQPIPLYASAGVAVPDSSDARYALARSVFRAMPAALSMWIGARLVRRFG